MLRAPSPAWPPGPGQSELRDEGVLGSSRGRDPIALGGAALALSSGVCHKGCVQDEAPDGGLRDEARRLLRASYERQVAGGGRVTHVDLGAGAEELGMDAEGDRLGVLLDYMDVMGWVETDLFAHDASGGAVRRITARGLAVVGES
jgi:hypothetical protein